MAHQELFGKPNAGEAVVLRSLSEQLPDSYVVLSGLQSVQGRQIDIVAIGPRAIVVVEVKAWTGCLSARQDGAWLVQTDSDRSVPFTLRGNTPQNPLEQIDIAWKSLKSYLARRFGMDQFPNIVRGLLVFASPEVRLDLSMLEEESRSTIAAADDAAEAIIALNTDRLAAQHLPISPELQELVVQLFRNRSLTCEYPWDSVRTPSDSTSHVLPSATRLIEVNETAALSATEEANVPEQNPESGQDQTPWYTTDQGRARLAEENRQMTTDFDQFRLYRDSATGRIWWMGTVRDRLKYDHQIRVFYPDDYPTTPPELMFVFDTLRRLPVLEQSQTSWNGSSTAADLVRLAIDCLRDSGL